MQAFALVVPGKSHLTVAASLFLLVLFVSSSLISGASRPRADIEYADFIKLTAADRLATFAELTPANKSALKRTHAERWLDRHQQELSAGQVAVVQEGIRFLSPATYRNAADPKLRRQEDQLKRKLECSLGRERVTEAFTFLGSRPERDWTQRVDEWLSWFKDCLVQ